MLILQVNTYACVAFAMACTLVTLLPSTASAVNVSDSAVPSASAVMLTRQAVEAFRNQDLPSALKYSDEALSKSGQMLSDEDAGVDQLILAKCDVFHGQPERALSHYEQALAHLRKSGAKRRTMLALSYAEAALLYAAEGNSRSAQEYMGRAHSVEAEVLNWTAEERVYLRDMQIHLECSAGRLTDARNTLRDTLDLFQADSGLSGHSRAHLYRDYAQISFASGQNEVALEYLHRSLDTLQTAREPWRDMMFTLTMLAEYQAAQHKQREAEASYMKAVEQAHNLEGTFPGESARVFASWGYYLSLRNRWRESRDAMQRAAVLTDSMPLEGDKNVEYWHFLAKIDRHLHERHEAVEAEQRARRESISAKTSPPAQQMTVDVLALQASR